MRRMSGLAVWLLMLGCGAPPPSGSDAAVDAGGCGADAECDDGLFCNGAERCTGGACTPAAPPCGDGSCDEAADACGPCAAPDRDGDGRDAIECGGDDCDDDDPLRFPGNAEVCDVSDVDEDCDPSTYGFRDADSDGAPDARCCNVQPDATRLCGDDCDDMRPTVSRTSSEVCDGIDNDCDTSIDEAVLSTYYADGDGDGYGRADDTMDGCAPPAMYASMAGDCDDGVAGVHPGAADGPPGACNAANDDCDTTIDEGCVCVAPDSRPCGTADPTTGMLIDEGACAIGTQVCAGGTWATCIGAVAPTAEVCGNAADDDCDGVIDDGCPCPSLTNETRTIMITPRSSGHVFEVVGGVRVRYLSSTDLGGDVEITCEATGHVLEASAHIPAGGSWSDTYRNGRPYMAIIEYAGGNWDAMTLDVRVLAF